MQILTPQFLNRLSLLSLTSNHLYLNMDKTGVIWTLLNVALITLTLSYLNDPTDSNNHGPKRSTPLGKEYAYCIKRIAVAVSLYRRNRPTVIVRCLVPLRSPLI